jgi:hypothetical protein
VKENRTQKVAKVTKTELGLGRGGVWSWSGPVEPRERKSYTEGREGHAQGR